MIRATLILFLSLLGLFQECFGEDWKRVYLATFPRSGNHWVRYLIEEATHIATSSAYRDYEMPFIAEPFPWGGYCCFQGYGNQCRYPEIEDYVVIKTHFPYGNPKPKPFENHPYVKAIRIVRHPVDCFYSCYVYEHHYNHKPLPQVNIPLNYVKECIHRWRRFQEHWNKQKNVLTFRYEDLYENPAKVLKKILKALHYSVKETDIARAISKYPPEGGPLKHLIKFGPEELKLITDELMDLMQQFEYIIP